MSHRAEWVGSTEPIVGINAHVIVTNVCYDVPGPDWVWTKSKE